MMIQFTFFLAYVGYSPILYLYTPDHWCSIPQEVQDKVNFTNMVDLLDVLIPYDEKIQKRSQCLMYDISGIDDPSDLLLNNSAFVPFTTCTNGYTYNFTGYFHSASTEVSYFSVYFLLFPYPKNFSHFFSSHWKKQEQTKK